MGDIIKMRPKGSSIDTLYQAAEEVMQDDTLKAIVVLYTDDPTEMICMYSEDVDPVSAFYVLNRSAQWQLGLDDE